VCLDRSFSRLLRVLPLVLTAAALHAQVLVTLSTSANSVQGNQTATLTALVTGNANAAVSWSLSPNVGTLGAGSGPDAGGLSTNTYRAPTLISSHQTITITATSVADPSRAATVQIQLQPIAVTVLVNPASATLTAGQTQQFSAVVTGVSATGVTWSINPVVAPSIPTRACIARRPRSPLIKRLRSPPPGVRFQLHGDGQHHAAGTGGSGRRDFSTRLRWATARANSSPRPLPIAPTRR